jgi:hypothetical protein
MCTVLLPPGVNQTAVLKCIYISQHNEKDGTVKISKFFHRMEIINRTLKPSQVKKHTRLKNNNTLALPALLYGCESLAVREQDK